MRIIKHLSEWDVQNETKLCTYGGMEQLEHTIDSFSSTKLQEMHEQSFLEHKHYDLNPIL